MKQIDIVRNFQDRVHYLRISIVRNDESINEKMYSIGYWFALARADMNMARPDKMSRKVLYIYEQTKNDFFELIERVNELRKQ